MKRKDLHSIKSRNDLTRNKVAIVGVNGWIGKEILKIIKPNMASLYSRDSSDTCSYFNLEDQSSWDTLINARPQKLLFLPWLHLNDFQSTRHLTYVFPKTFQLLQFLLNNGLERLVVAGTCYEYGSAEGLLSPYHCTRPTTPYGLSKDFLHKSLELMVDSQTTKLVWARIFYPYGLSQRKSSLLPSLITASLSGEKQFLLGNCDLIRDFIPVETVAEQLLRLLFDDNASGPYNCGTGTPRSLRSFVEELIKTYDLDIDPVYCSLPKRSGEPFASWADMSNWSDIDTLSNL